MARCKDCEGYGSVKVDCWHKRLKKWVPYYTEGGNTGQDAYTFCRACDGTGDGEHPPSGGMPSWAGPYNDCPRSDAAW